jgi:tetratricopeptide (TPR) repeat protein
MKKRQALYLVLSVAFVAVVTLLSVEMGHKGVAGMKTTLAELRDALLSLLEIVAIVLLFLVAGMVYRRISAKRTGIVFLPFENSIVDAKYSGKILTDSLLAELQRIDQIYADNPFLADVERERIGIQVQPHEPFDLRPEPTKSPEEVPMKKAVPKPLEIEQRVGHFSHADCEFISGTEGTETTFADAITVGVGSTTVSIGRLLIALRDLCGFQNKEDSIRGSLQRFGSLTQLVARTANKNGRRGITWEVSAKTQADDEIPLLIRELAYKVHKDIRNISSMKTSSGFKQITDAICAYRQYLVNSQFEDLENAKLQCLEAAQKERGNWLLFELLCALGYEYFNREEYQTAETLFSDADATISSGSYPLDESLRARCAEAHNAWGAALACQEKRVPAERVFRRAIQLNNKLMVAYQNLSLLLCNSRRLDEAKATITQAKALGLLGEGSSIESGDWYATLGFSEEACEQYKQALTREQNKAPLHIKLGDLYAEANRMEEAIEQFQAAARLDSKNAYAGCRLADMYAEVGRTKDAVSEYRRAILINPEYPYTHINLGLLLESLGEDEDARTEYLCAIRLGLELADIHHNLAVLYSKAGKTEEAAAQYQCAIDLEPKSSESLSGLGEILAENGHPEEAISLFKRAIECEPEYGNLHAHVWLGFTLAGLNRLKEAVEEVKCAIKLQPEYRWAHAALASYYRRLGRDEDYRKQLQIARELPAQANEDDYTKACIEALCGNAKEATRLLKKALDEGQRTVEYARNDNDFESIRNDTDFKKLVEVQE